MDCRRAQWKVLPRRARRGKNAEAFLNFHLSFEPLLNTVNFMALHFVALNFMALHFVALNFMALHFVALNFMAVNFTAGSFRRPDVESVSPLL